MDGKALGSEQIAHILADIVYKTQCQLRIL